MPPQTILCPVDFSECSAQALDHAAALASTFDAKVYLLHVCEPPPYSLPSSTPHEERNDEVFDRLHVLATRGGPHISRLSMIVRGNPHREIARVANELHADLVVMGTHGRTGLPRLLLGSVAERVIRSSTVPVMTVPSRER